MSKANETKSAVSARWASIGIHRIPHDVRDQLGEIDPRDDAWKMCVSSPMLLDGQFGESWLAAGRDRLAIISRNGDGLKVTWSTPLESVTGARTRKVSGGGVLIMDVDGQAREVLCYDNGHAPLFGEVARRIQKHVKPEKEKDEDAKGKETGLAEEARQEKPSKPLEFSDLITRQRDLRCPKCEQAFPKNTKICSLCVQRGSTLKRILEFAAPFKKQLVLMGVLMVTGMLLHLAPPYLFKVLVDDVLMTGQDAHRILPLVGLLALVMVLDMALTIIRSRIAVYTGCSVTNNIQQTVFKHLQSQSMSYFIKQQTGALMARVSSDTRQMESLLVDGIQYTVVNFLQVIGVAAVMIWINPLLGIVVLIPTPFVIVVSKWAWKRVIRRFRLLYAAQSAVSAYLNDALSGIRVVKAFGQEPVEIARYEKKIFHARDQAIVAEKTWQTLIPFLNLIVQSSLLLVWYIGSKQVFDRQLTLGELLAYISYLAMIFGPLQLLTRLNDWLSRSLTAAARVFEVLDAHAEVQEDPEAVSWKDPRGAIELRNVNFGYDKHEPVIKNLSLSLKQGEMVGLVGHSGSGKSTLINLIGRLYDVDAGALLLDGMDVRKIKLEDLRRNVGFVLQDTFLFNGTIAENIAYARPNAPRREIIQAAVTANAHSFIMKQPDHYDTLVGERGTRLSGGERQRIAIARAILHDPKILILDEATASVDTETESKIQQALGKLVKGRTTIAIAHRLSTLRHADRLMVIDNGMLKEEGTHAELMAKEKGVYRKLVEIQTEWSQTIGVGG